MTRQRSAAMERAVAAYRRLIRVDIHHTAMEMIADLIAYHVEFVGSVNVDELLADAKRRFETLGEDERDSEARNEDMFAPPTDEQRTEAAQRLDNAFHDMLRQMTQQQQAYETQYTTRSGYAGPSGRMWFSEDEAAEPQEVSEDAEG